jgi:ATP-dependent RNA helicase SUPV3L1/SUV3
MTNSNLSEMVEGLDALTGGALSASTASERATRIKEWLTSNPPVEQLQAAFKELSLRDKGAAKHIRAQLDEIRRTKNQESATLEWQNKAEKILSQPKFNMADGLAWLRDAPKVNISLAQEPFLTLKNQLGQSIKGIEDVQRRVQVQAEAAVLLAQRVEVLSAKPWRTALNLKDGLHQDVLRWKSQAESITNDQHWINIGVKFPNLLESSKVQLLLVFDAFQATLTQAQEASEDLKKPLPSVPVWAEEIVAARTSLNPNDSASLVAPNNSNNVTTNAVLRNLLQQLDLDMSQGHSKATSSSAHNLRLAFKEHSRAIDDTLRAQISASLDQASKLSDWQRWRANQLRNNLVSTAEDLLKKNEGITPQKLQEILRDLREQWRQTDQGGAPNHVLWKKFDEACSKAYKEVDEWLEKTKAESGQRQQVRLSLIDELKNWSKQQKTSVESDWKEYGRHLHEFSEQWRAAGHIGDKLFYDLHAQWKESMAAARAPLDAVQANNLNERHDLIAQAEKLSQTGDFNVEEVRSLQTRWKELSQEVVIDRKNEQKLWNLFREQLDKAFENKTKLREQSQVISLSAHDQAVSQAARAVRDACQSRDVSIIQATLSSLNNIMQGSIPELAQQVIPIATTPISSEITESLNSNVKNDVLHEEQKYNNSSTEESYSNLITPFVATSSTKKIVAMRGDDRPNANKNTVIQSSHSDKNKVPRKDGRFDSKNKNDTRLPTPRLADSVFRSQKEASDQAKILLKQLSQQVHGQSFDILQEAWEKRDGTLLPTAQQFGVKAVTNLVRSNWLLALENKYPSKLDSETALLRLEIAADIPTQAEYQVARRQLQMQLLTKRNDPGPKETWTEDVANAISSKYTQKDGGRLSKAVKQLLSSRY